MAEAGTLTFHCSRCGNAPGTPSRFCTRCGAPLTARGSDGVAATEAELASAAGPPAATLERFPPAGAGWWPDSAAGTPPPAPIAPPAPEVRYAGFWRRVWAAAVDLVVLLPFQAALDITIGVSPFSTEYGVREWGAATAGGALALGYCAALESSRWQGTLGQQLLGMRVTTVRGARIGLARALARHIAQLLSNLLLFTGYLLIPFTPRKQALHDLLSGCVLVRGTPSRA